MGGNNYENFVRLGDARVAVCGAVWELAGVKYLRATLLVAGIWLAGELAWTVHKVRPRLEVTLSNLDRTIIIAGAAATHLEKASGQWQEASKQQAKESTEILVASKVALGRISLLASNLDTQLNKSLIPSISIAVESQSRALLSSETKLTSVLDDMAQTTTQAQKVLETANEHLSNPAIAQSLQNIEATTANVAASTAEADKAITDLRQIADKARETYLKPVNLWWAVVKELLPLAGSAAQVVK